MIPKGRKYAITRENLIETAVDLGYIDEECSNKYRTLKRLLEKAREEVVICNLQDGKGYFIPEPEDVEYLKRYIKAEQSKGKSIFRNLQMAVRLYDDFTVGRIE